MNNLPGDNIIRPRFRCWWHKIKTLLVPRTPRTKPQDQLRQRRRVWQGIKRSNTLSLKARLRASGEQWLSLLLESGSILCRESSLLADFLTLSCSTELSALKRVMWMSLRFYTWCCVSHSKAHSRCSWVNYVVLETDSFVLKTVDIAWGWYDYRFV